jgi:hypothetical protein
VSITRQERVPRQDRLLQTVCRGSQSLGRDGV